jgi:putative Mg2+ transporter-C (MgtC) family protein
MDTLLLTLHVLAALLFGAVIGAERQWRQRMAGLRTNTLVCMGSALFVSLSAMVDHELSRTRIAAQVVSGIGFLGAGVIMKEGLNIRGLNTAATLWCSAAVGVLAGSGFILAAAIGTGAVLVANVLLRPVASRINREPPDSIELETIYRLRVSCHREDETHIRAMILEAAKREGLMLRGILSEDTPDSRLAEVRADLLSTGRQDALAEQILKTLSLQTGVTGISWEVRPSGGE